MRSLERSRTKESLDSLIASVAHVYGFSGAPLVVPRKAGDLSDDARTSMLISTVAKSVVLPPTPTPGVSTGFISAQAWGLTKHGKGGSTVAYVIAATKHAISQAFAVKSALSTAEVARCTNLTVLVSSVGDRESQHRYTRELNNFFRKHAKEVPEEVHDLVSTSVTDAALHLAKIAHPLAESLPRTVDYLSEASRKVMLETLTLFESLKIPYELAPRLPMDVRLSGSGNEYELVFVIEGTDATGARVRIATGGRFEVDRTIMTGMAVQVPESLDVRDMRHTPVPVCFVVHVGEAAKLKAFTLLDSLWHAHVALDQAILATSIQDQMKRAHDSGAKYLAIIGQREALDDTVIVRNVGTQLQETVPLTALVTRLVRVRA